MNDEKKRQEEKKILSKMVHVYCRGQKHDAPQKHLCADCAALLAYAHDRTSRCPRMACKTFCSKCPVQCYRPEMREGIRDVMRYAGPRLLVHSPLLVLKHVLTRKERSQNGSGIHRINPAKGVAERK